MKKGWIIAVAVLALLFLLSISKDLVIKVSVEKWIELVTGLKLEIRSLNAGIFRSAVSIKGLRVFNPPHFKERVMIEMPEIYVDYDLPAIVGGNIHLRYLRINLKEFIVVKNAEGELNLNSLKVVSAKKEGVKPEDREGGKAPNIQIDNLELKIDKAFYKDYSRGPEPSVKEFDVNLNERYTNITNPYSLVSIIVVKALANTTISSMTNFDINGLKGTVGDVLSKATNIAGRATDIAQQALQTTTQNAPEAVKGASETVEKAAGALGDIFKDVTNSNSGK